MLPRNAFSSDAEHKAALRDWFAGQALSGAMVGSYNGETISEDIARQIAEESYIVADAMLAERERQS
jgi:hypothetical protein